MRPWQFDVVLRYATVYLLCYSFTESTPVIGETSSQESSSTRVLRRKCKLSAFKLETIISSLDPNFPDDCQVVCTDRFKRLEESIGKGVEALKDRPILGPLRDRKKIKIGPISEDKKVAGNRRIVPEWLDDCMATKFHCLLPLSAQKLSDDSLIEDYSLRLTVATAKTRGEAIDLKQCHCGATLKLWKVYRDDILVTGKTQKTNCSNVEICKRLTSELSSRTSPTRWACAAETTLNGFVKCLNRPECHDHPYVQVCKLCNSGSLAKLNCEPVDWSDAAQKNRARGIERFIASIKKGQNSGKRADSLATELEISAEDLLCDQSYNIDGYHRLQLQIPPGETQTQSVSPIPYSAAGTSIFPHQATSQITFSQSISNLLPVLPVSTDDFVNFGMDLSISFAADASPFSVPLSSQTAPLTSFASSDNHAQNDQKSTPDFDNGLDLDEMLPKRSRFERGESSQSASNRASSEYNIRARGNPSQRYVNQDTHPSTSYLPNFLPAASTAFQQGLEAQSTSMHPGGETIRLDGSWLDIYSQLGPANPVEPMPDLASLGNLQMNGASSVGYNTEQPSFEDLIDGGDPPELTEEELNDLLDGIM